MKLANIGCDVYKYCFLQWPCCVEAEADDSEHITGFMLLGISGHLRVWPEGVVPRAVDMCMWDVVP